MIEATLAGMETATYGGEAWTGPNAEGDLCRALIGRGVDPGERIAFLRNGVPSLVGSIGAFARRAYEGGDARSRAWRPHPRQEMPAPLAAWYARTAPKASRLST